MFIYSVTNFLTFFKKNFESFFDLLRQTQCYKDLLQLLLCPTVYEKTFSNVTATIDYNIERKKRFARLFGPFFLTVTFTASIWLFMVFFSWAQKALARYNSWAQKFKLLNFSYQSLPTCMSSRRNCKKKSSSFNYSKTIYI